jgi:hypothetical protein
MNVYIEGKLTKSGFVPPNLYKKDLFEEGKGRLIVCASRVSVTPHCCDQSFCGEEYTVAAGLSPKGEVRKYA